MCIRLISSQGIFSIMIKFIKYHTGSKLELYCDIYVVNFYKQLKNEYFQSIKSADGVK